MRDDWLTVSAVAIIAMCVATFAHEAAGHGTACLLADGKIALLTSVYFQCAAHSRFIAIAGPIGNLAAAALGWLALGVLPERARQARLFAFALAALSIFWAAGYLVEAMIVNRGDYVYAGQDWLGEPSPWWRTAGIAIGVASYIVSVRILAREAEGLSSRVSALLRAVWLAASVAAVAAAAFYAGDKAAAMEQAFLEIGAASFPLLLMGYRIPAKPDTPPIARNRAWIAISAIVFIAFTATLGRGLP